MSKSKAYEQINTRKGPRKQRESRTEMKLKINQENDMRQDQADLRDFEREMENAVKLGHAERDAQGRYRLTPSGRKVVARHQLLEVLDRPDDAAYTFGALVKATGVDPADIIPALAKLIHDGVVEVGFLKDSDQARIFRLFSHRKTPQLCTAEDESPCCLKYRQEAAQTMELVREMSVHGTQKADATLNSNVHKHQNKENAK